jgi:hypothetical protein
MTRRHCRCNKTWCPCPSRGSHLPAIGVLHVSSTLLPILGVGRHLVAARTLPLLRRCGVCGGADDVVGLAVWAQDITVRARVSAIILCFIIRVSIWVRLNFVAGPAPAESRQNTIPLACRVEKNCACGAKEEIRSEARYFERNRTGRNQRPGFLRQCGQIHSNLGRQKPSPILANQAGTSG